MAFHNEGAHIAFIDKDNESGTSLLDKLNMESPGNFFYHGDVGIKSDLEIFTNQVLDTYGKIDYLVNNACYSNKGILSGCSYEEFNEVLAVGVTAPYYLALLLKDSFNKGASIVNISSTRSFMSQSDTESYSAAKGGISTLTHALAMSLAGIVRVNSICPGWIDTSGKDELNEFDRNQHPSKRVGVPEDIARIVLFLCDERSSFINAENITVDGGMSRRMIYHDDEGWLLTNNDINYI